MIRPEIIKYAGEKGENCLYRIIRKAWSMKNVPEDWTTTAVTLFRCKKVITKNVKITEEYPYLAQQRKCMRGPGKRIRSKRRR